MASMIELRCSRDLALRLGAIGPDNVAHHRQLRDAGHLLVRDYQLPTWPLFWPWIGPCIEVDAVAKSSEK
jgi:hypothetical protein